MTTVAVNVRRVDERQELEADLRAARSLAKLLDSQFSIAGFKFGLDALVGLIPVAGDTIMLAASIYPIYLARKHKLGKHVELRMSANVAIDYFVGLVPLVGDFFDASYKANLKNVDLLEKAAKKS